MGSPAMRITDQTAHGGVVVMGFPTVIINNMPASRITDMHTCPLVNGVVPHVGGPFIMGSFTVIVGNMPQSRVTDMLICVGPPDTAVKGEPTVLVGMAGAMGLMGILKGLLMAGISLIQGGTYPRAVLNPGTPATYSTQYSPNITIEGTPEFQAKAVRDLNKIAATKTGQKLLQSLADSGKKIRIHTDRSVSPSGKVTTGNYAYTDPPPSGKPPNPGWKGGGPADAQVGYDPDRDRLAGTKDSWAQPPNRPPDVGLFHELTHCDDFTHGKLDDDTQVANGTKSPATVPDSEARAVGLPPHDKEDFSENAYRSEQGLEKRPYY